jgi:hypothetical protein
VTKDTSLRLVVSVIPGEAVDGDVRCRADRHPCYASSGVVVGRGAAAQCRGDPTIVFSLPTSVTLASPL